MRRSHSVVATCATFLFASISVFALGGAAGAAPHERAHVTLGVATKSADEVAFHIYDNRGLVVGSTRVCPGETRTVAITVTRDAETIFVGASRLQSPCKPPSTKHEGAVTTPVSSYSTCTSLTHRPSVEYHYPGGFPLTARPICSG